MRVSWPVMRLTFELSLGFDVTFGGSNFATAFVKWRLGLRSMDACLGAVFLYDLLAWSSGMLVRCLSRILSPLDFCVVSLHAH